jgi:hypothetical protein
MANSKITDLTALAAIADNDEMVIEDTSETETKKTLWSTIKSVLKTYFDGVYGTPVSDEVMGGSGVDRTLAHAPISGTLIVYDGAARLHGGGVDFTQVGTAVTFNIAPDNPFADYRY